MADETLATASTLRLMILCATAVMLVFSPLALDSSADDLVTDIGPTFLPINVTSSPFPRAPSRGMGSIGSAVFQSNYSHAEVAPGANLTIPFSVRSNASAPVELVLRVTEQVSNRTAILVEDGSVKYTPRLRLEGSSLYHETIVVRVPSRVVATTRFSLNLSARVAMNSTSSSRDVPDDGFEFEVTNERFTSVFRFEYTIRSVVNWTVVATETELEGSERLSSVPGCESVLDFQLENGGNLPLTIGVSLEDANIDWMWYMEPIAGVSTLDDANGRSVRIGPYSTTPLQIVYRAPRFTAPGDSVLNVRFSAATNGSEKVRPYTYPISIAVDHAVSLALAFEDPRGLPGSATALDLEVVNTGNVVEEVLIWFEGALRDHLSLERYRCVLAPGGSTRIEGLLQLPAEPVLGVFECIVAVGYRDAANAYRFTELERVRASFRVLAPDLALHVSPLSAASEHSARILHVEVFNTGEALARNITIQPVLDGEPLQRRVIPFLAAGERRVVAVGFELDPGEHLIVLEVDPADRIFESNETNNIVSQRIEEPYISLTPTMIAVLNNILLTLLAVAIVLAPIVLILRRLRMP